MVFRDAAFMGIMRWEFYHQLKAKYSDIVSYIFGYMTKNTRIVNNLPKTHYVDARCISGNPNAKPLDYYYYQKKVRNHNRQIHKCTIQKGGIRKSNQAPKYVYGHQLFDKVLYNGIECYIFGRRSSGYFDLRLLDGTKISAGVSSKKLKLLECRKTILTQRRTQNCIV
jgi:N6-L-threonylcarbamoyladenine synthase